MTHAGMLRLDHVMGLHRLFFVPEGMAATDGVYVRYPADEQFAVVAIESVRAGCAVVGEDLGTVPTEVRDAMDRHRVLRSFVAEFSMPGAPGDDFVGPDHRSVASVDTHDTPTFAAFVRGADIVARHDAGRLSDDEAERADADRRRACDALAAVVAARGIGDVDPTGRGTSAARRAAVDARRVGRAGRAGGPRRPGRRDRAAERAGHRPRPPELGPAPPARPRRSWPRIRRSPRCSIACSGPAWPAMGGRC